MSQTTTTSTVNLDTLMAAIARMADRMATSVHASGLAVSSGGDWQQHHRHYVRRMRAMHRLMDALVRATGKEHSVWRLNHTLMTIADHKRDDRRDLTKGA